MNRNNILIIALMILSLLATTQAQTVNTGFSYQGELLDNGSPANGNYDIVIDAFTVVTGGSGFIFPPEFINVTVSNGLFSLDNVDFGDLLYLANSDIWLEISVRETSVGGSYTILTPRQKLNTSPFSVKSEQANSALTASSANTADNLSISGALVGDVLAYNGVNWASANFFHVNGNGGTSIGGSDVPAANGLVVVGNTRLGASFTPTQSVTLDINSDASGNTDDPFRVRKNEAIKFYVDSNGGASVGSWNTPPANGLRVNGKTKFDGNIEGDINQDFANSGIIKYMAYVNCTGINPSIIRAVNSTGGAGGVGVSEDTFFGNCILDFPDDVSQRYWQVSATDDDLNASCRYIGVNSSDSRMRCDIRDGTGVRLDGKFMIFVY